MGPDRAAACQNQRGNYQPKRENCRRPKWDDHRARAHDPVILQNPKPKSPMAAGVAGECGVGAGGGKVFEVPAGFGRMPSLAIGGPGAGVVDEFSVAGIEAALKVIPFARIVLMGGVE